MRGTLAAAVVLAGPALAEEDVPAAVPQETEVEVEVEEVAQAEAEEPVFRLPTVEIIGTTPVQGTGVAKEKVPANVQTIGRDDFDRAQPLGVSDMLNRRLGNVTVNDAQSNPFQPDVQFRGFTASPLLGNPQGIAVYQGGVRINEPFGDVVQWDMIPEFAIESIQLIPGSNPVFGLNALGGALSIQMKNGFTHDGLNAEAYGGSFGRRQFTGEYGARVGDFAFYAGATGFDEDGWRDQSPSDIEQFFGDARYRNESTEAALNFVYANSDLNGNGASPVQLLELDREAVFTYPDNTRNEMFFGIAEGNHSFTDTVSVQGNAYFRRLQRATLNGDEQEFEDCTGIDGPPGTLCESAGNPDEEQIKDLNGNPIPTTAGGDGAFNTSGTDTTGIGGSLQATVEEDLFGKENLLVFGGSFDYGAIEFGNQSEVGALTPDRTVLGSGIFVAGNEFNTRIDATNKFIGIYFTDTLSITDDTAVTFAGRYNHANIEIKDYLGTELNGDHTFERFNPAIGVTHQVFDGVTAYAGYSESNRAPTAVELSCADPTQPCRVPNAFLADPPLDQVVSRSVEVGLRGRLANMAGGVIEWSVAGFGSRNFDDIIFISAGPIGTGFFQNAGITQRVGAEFGLNGVHGPFQWYANYGFVEATFESHLRVSSPAHPLADAGGEIQVLPGDRIPGIPRHTAKLGVGVSATERWFVGIESLIASDQVLRGDEANLLDTVAGYGIVNLMTTYRIVESGNPFRLEAFLQVKNLFDNDYETFGLLGDAAEVLGSEFDNPRFLGPGAPRGIWGGLRIWFN